MSDWPEYVSHKVVRAARIVFVGYKTPNDGTVTRIQVDPDDTGSWEDFWPSFDGMANSAVVGGFAVIYAPDEKHPDGYRSISPAKAFEEGYTRVTGS